MITKNTTIKDLPLYINLATFDCDDEEIFLCEYTLATLIYNGATFNQLLELVDDIKKTEEKKVIKKIIIDMVLEFINLNPHYIYLIKDSVGASVFWSSMDIDFVLSNNLRKLLLAS